MPKISSELVQLEHCQNQILLDTVVMRAVAKYSLFQHHEVQDSKYSNHVLQDV